MQEEAIGHFNRLGLPTTRNEEWKYTNITPLFSRNFNLPAAGPAISKDELIRRFPFLKGESFVVLENGRMIPESSEIHALPDGIFLKNLNEARDLPAVKNHFNRYVDVEQDAFAALNTAFAREGLVVIVSEKRKTERPLYILNVALADNEAVVSHNRLLVICEKYSTARISNIVISGNEHSESFVNEQVEIFLDEQASLEFDVLQDENRKSFHINGTHVYQSANSRFDITTAALGGSILRNKLHIKLNGENAEAHMHGLYVANGTQLIDNHTAVYHSMPHCNSNELYKGLVGGKAHAVFNGKILVEKDAQKTNAYQSNKNILLNNDAVVNAKPQLEIFADDVKCTHGATTGQMDDEALFYLRARGIPEKNAKALLNLAFANDILGNITAEPFRNFTAGVVESKLKEVF